MKIRKQIRISEEKQASPGMGFRLVQVEVARRDSEEEAPLSPPG
jgi:hypothetical protein